MGNKLAAITGVLLGAAATGAAYHFDLGPDFTEFLNDKITQLQESDYLNLSSAVIGALSAATITLTTIAIYTIPRRLFSDDPLEEQARDIYKKVKKRPEEPLTSNIEGLGEVTITYSTTRGNKGMAIRYYQQDGTRVESLDRKKPDGLLDQVLLVPTEGLQKRYNHPRLIPLDIQQQYEHILSQLS